MGLSLQMDKIYIGFSMLKSCKVRVEQKHKCPSVWYLDIWVEMLTTISNLLLGVNIPREMQKTRWVAWPWIALIFFCFLWSGDRGGCIIVDSTRRGKRFPDSMSKTIPIWCCVLNRAVERHRLRAMNKGGEVNYEVVGVLLLILYPSIILCSKQHVSRSLSCLLLPLD